MAHDCVPPQLPGGAPAVSRVPLPPHLEPDGADTDTDCSGGRGRGGSSSAGGTAASERDAGAAAVAAGGSGGGSVLEYLYGSREGPQWEEMRRRRQAQREDPWGAAAEEEAAAALAAAGTEAGADGAPRDLPDEAQSRRKRDKALMDWRRVRAGEGRGTGRR